MIIPRYKNLWRGITFAHSDRHLFVLLEDDLVFV